MEPHGSNPLLWSQSHYQSDLDCNPDDFSSFLNLTDINLDIPNFDHAALHENGTGGNGDGNNGSMGMKHHPQGHHAGGGAENVGIGGEGMDLDNYMGDSGGAGQMHGHHSMNEHHMTDVSDLEFAQLEQSVAQLSNPHHQNMVPPTPTSMELRSSAQAQEREKQYRQRNERSYGGFEEQMIFTPLISPAVTPLEPSFATVPDFSMPGSYFSPITSPALEAQYHSVGSKFSQLPSAHSPIDPQDSPNLSRRPATNNGRRKSIIRSGPSRVVKESPIIKPQKKKADLASQLSQIATSSSPHISIPVGSAVSTPTSSGGNMQQQMQQHLSQNMDFARESSDSISPEPLSEMPPPPPPSKSRRTSMVGGKAAMPATPASLMRLSKAEEAVSSASFANLPNPALPISSSSGIVIGANNPSSTTSGRKGRTPSQSPALRPTAADSETTPTLSAKRGTPILAPKSSSSKSSSATRKRPSTSTDASPVILPRLSPAILPRPSPNLAPMPTSHPHTVLATTLLASKSNYQNILEGNSSSLGLSYPEELGTHLTSKRTSHKLAEQGRRDRINSAIAELAGLLPKNEEVKGMSKAGVVECGIKFIRSLKSEIEELRAEVERLKGGGGGSASSGSSGEEEEKKDQGGDGSKAAEAVETEKDQDAEMEGTEESSAPTRTVTSRKPSPAAAAATSAAPSPRAVEVKAQEVKRLSASPAPAASSPAAAAPSPAAVGTPGSVKG